MTEALLTIAGLLVAGLWGLWLGKQSGRNKIEERSAQADATREEIEDAVNADANLVDRARRSGLVRPE